VTIIVFILGCFLDFFEIAFIVVPLLVKPAETLGIDLIWLGIILGINLQTSFLTPPFGFGLFYLRSISPLKAWNDEVTGKRIEGIRTVEIYKGALPYIAIQFVAIMIVIAFPRLVTHYKDSEPTFNLDDVQIQLPGMGAPQAPSGLPGLPGQDGGGGNGGFGLPGGLNLNGTAPSGLGDQSGGNPPATGLPGLPGGLNLNGTPPAVEPAPAEQPADLSQPPKIQ
jgi:hypothetical protein